MSNIIKEVMDLIPKHIKICEKNYLEAENEATAKYFRGAIDAYTQIYDMVVASHNNEKALTKWT